MQFKLLSESNATKDLFVLFMGDELADRFYKLKHKLKSPENDISYWISKASATELEKRLDELEPIEPDKIIGDWRIYRILSSDQLSKIIGRHKAWCLQSPESFATYKAQGDNFILFQKDNKNYIRIINKNNPFEEAIYISANERAPNDSDIYKEIMSLPIEDLL